MIPRNPFQPTKIEHDNEPVFLLSETARSIPSNFKNHYVSGSRGSGKTTLLRSLSTIDISKSRALAGQYDRSKFDWFGIYIQFSKTLQPIVSRNGGALIEHLNLTSASVDPDEIQFSVFHAYLELSVLLSFIKDIRWMLATDDVGLQHRQEREACRAILDRLGFKNAWPDFASLQDALEITLASFSSLPTAPALDSLAVLIGAFSPGELLQKAGGIAASLKGTLFRKNAPIRLMILIDDAELLSDRQQVFLNTLAKRLEGDVKFVITYISGLFNPNETLLKDTVLKNDDFTLVDLDNSSFYDFFGFCSRVTDLRLKHFFERSSGDGKGDLPNFSLRRTLGEYGLNELIAASLSGSQSVGVERWRSQVEARKQELRAVLNRRNWSKYSVEDGQYPFIEHELISLLGIDMNDLKSLKEQDSKAKSFDRKQVGALIYIYSSILPNRNIPYAGANIICELATVNIRDYLDIMAAIFDVFMEGRVKEWDAAKGARPTDLRAFVEPSRPLSIEIQRKGVQRASETKWDILNNFTISSGFNVPIFVLALGELTKNLQRPREPRQFVSSADRGLLMYDPQRLDKILETKGATIRSDDVIRTLQRDGFINVGSSRTRSTHSLTYKGLEVFHLHRRLFPRLGISYRGPYVQFRLDEIAIASLLDAGSVDPVAWGAEFAKKEPEQEKYQKGLDL